MKISPLLKNWRVLLLLAFLLFSYVAIQPQFFGNDGVAIRSVAPNSSAANGGIENPSPKLTPLGKETITRLDSTTIMGEDDYYDYISKLPANTTVRVQTSRATYTLITDGANLGLRVYDAPVSNLRKGLDLAGGTRVLLKPQEKVSQEDLQTTIESLQQRLNVYGLSDVVIREASDLQGEDFILIEIAGVTEEEVQQLLASQGKFEATIADQPVFSGGDKDITYVCRTADCSGIDPRRGCQNSGDGYFCSFFFSITLSPEAAQRQAQLTGQLKAIREEGQCYLDKDLVLYLDDQEVDSLRIGCELQGRQTSNIQISGSGSGRTQQEAITNTLDSMKRLQTIIITGSLPVQLNVVKLDSISPSLGHEFLENIIKVGLLAILAVILVIYLRYRRLKVVIPMILTLLSEMVMILGFAALVGTNLDLAAIAGIIIVAGTGVDHLVVITDETLRGERSSSWKNRLKNAMFIVVGAYLTTLAGMLPLLWAGAGLLKGFALTTIAGISFGVLIARPAFAAVIEILLGNE
ncbi:hypothetical protein COV20_04575 [Candidatus Woesearchaeota archaeon CG10_big_fil_rev_8_21_14_0_10_45_16]|nr:MAG: hypothetical protein COV20_04575 [Candidatus Woesearchaeota archaeon CG10_big_fil_rev_8_21_14_0_10_45_16]